MRYKPEHKAYTRVRILDAAAKVFREQGFVAGNVDDVMAEAGLTAGGFYAHFESKAALLAAVLRHTAALGIERLERGLEQCSDDEWIQAVMERYLSPAHCCQPANGCPMPPLLADIARSGPESKQAFEAFLRETGAWIEARLPDDAAQPAREHAFALLAIWVGGLSLARAVANPELADQILAACREFARSTQAAPHRLRPSRKQVSRLTATRRGAAKRKGECHAQHPRS